MKCEKSREEGVKRGKREKEKVLKGGEKRLREEGVKRERKETKRRRC